MSRIKVLPQYVLPKTALTNFAGRVAGAKGGAMTTSLIRWFVGKYGVNMDEAANPDIASYTSFNDFFTRPLREDARPLAVADFVCPVDGAISPFGGPKGYALGLVLEVLVATVTRTALGEDVRGTLDPTDPSTKGDLFLALDPAAFGPGAAPVAAYLAALRETVPAPGHDSVLVPGDRARATRATHLAEGVPVSQGTWDLARQIAADVPERH